MSTTSTVQMFYAGNFADMDTFEGNQTNEQPDYVLGTHDDLVVTSVSEVDVDEDGVIYDDEYGTGDYLRYDLGTGTATTALDSTSLYNADILLGDGPTPGKTLPGCRSWCQAKIQSTCRDCCCLFLKRVGRFIAPYDR
jgi:hypothetical protein